MKKLLVMCFFMLSFQVMAAQETPAYTVTSNSVSFLYTGLPPGGPYLYLLPHGLPCNLTTVPVISSMETGHFQLALWVIQLESGFMTLSLFNTGASPVSGSVKIRFNGCQPR